MRSVPNRAVWIATANNVRMHEDIGRRAMFINVDARVEDPWEMSQREQMMGRKFRHENIMRWAHDHRGQLVAAALSLCQAWIAAGQPKGKYTLGSFESWSWVMGGILDVIGVPGFMENHRARYQAATVDRSATVRFIES